MDTETIKVFIVDASEVWRKILVNHISSSPNMEVVGEINSSQGSILMLEEVNPDVVLLEVNENDRMPLEEVVTQLKAIDPKVRIILCSDHAAMNKLLSTKDLEVYDFIAKPYKRQAILRSIEECMHHTLSS